MAIFEEVKISQQQSGVLLTSFYIFLHSSIPFRWWCYLKDSPSGLGGELFNYLRLFIFILGYVITSLHEDYITKCKMNRHIYM